jgi:hypothetical protein
LKKQPKEKKILLHKDQIPKEVSKKEFDSILDAMLKAPPEHKKKEPKPGKT